MLPNTSIICLDLFVTRNCHVNPFGSMTLDRMLAACALFFVTGAEIVADQPGKWTLSENQSQKIDSIFAKLSQGDRPGCSVAVQRGDKIVYEKGFGLAQLEYGIPINTDTIFHVASVSKQFTVFAVALLAADGKLDLDDEIRDHVPEVPDFGQLITLRHLIHHTSGLRDQWDLFVLSGGRMDDVIRKSDIIELVANQVDLNFSPGQEHLYCNTGYTLLAMVVERVSGMSLNEFCQRRIFGPLAMAHTHFHDNHQHIVAGRAYSYRKMGKDKYQKSVLSYANAGATSLFTTGADLMRWQQNFADRSVGNDDLFATMLTPGKLNDGTELDYAGGLVHGTYKGLKLISHGGADAGFRSFLGRFPQQNLSIAILGNYANCNPRNFAMKIADVILMDQFPNLDKESAEASGADQPPETGGETDSELATQAELECTGWYFDPTEASLYVVTAKDKQLYLQFGYVKPILLTRLGPFRFQSTIKKYPLTIKFRNDKDAATDAATLSIPGRKAAVMEEVGPKGEVQDYAETLPGRYFSDELESFYKIVLDGDRFLLRRRRHEDANLRMRFRDGFNAGNNIIRLTRDTNNHITGFLLSTGRVRDLRFHRVDADDSILKR